MKKILSISLAFILLLSNMGFTMGTHFCGGLPVKSELMIGESHLDCGMHEIEKEADGHDHDPQLKPSQCCDNQYQTFEVEDDFKISQEQISISPEFVAALVYTFLNPAFLVEFDQHSFTDYSPPLLLWDIPVLNQVFLI